MAAQKMLTFCGIRTPGKRIFAHPPLSKQYLALSMATALCVCVSQPPAQSIKIQQKMPCRCTFLASLPQWVGHSRCLGYGQVRLPNEENDISLRATAQIPH